MTATCNRVHVHILVLILSEALYMHVQCYPEVCSKGTCSSCTLCVFTGTHVILAAGSYNNVNVQSFKCIHA